MLAVVMVLDSAVMVYMVLIGISSIASSPINSVDFVL